MKHRLLTLVLPLCLALLPPALRAEAAACPILPPPETAAEQAPRDRGALWQIEKNGLRSWVFGSVHLGRAAWQRPGPQLERALRQTAVLAVELDVTDPGFAPALMIAQAAAAPLALSPAEQARLDAQAAAACLPPGALGGLHPLMQVTTLVSLAGRRDGLDPAFGQELALLARARADGKTVRGLETVQRQLQALLPAEPLRARQLLRQGLDGLEDGSSRRTLQRLGKAWQQGDLAAVASPEQICQCQPSAAERAMLVELNDGRNPGLAAGIAALHAEGKPLLAAVGLLHMTGPQALPRLLREQHGFRVTRVY